MRTGQKKFRSDFWRRVNVSGGRVRDLMGAIRSSNRDRVVALLELASDPLVEKRLKRESNRLFTSVLQPASSRKELSRLSQKLESVARDLDRMRKQLFAVGLQSPVLLADRLETVSRNVEMLIGGPALGEECHKRAKYIKLALKMNGNKPKGKSALTYRGFTKHLPMLLLCRELDAPSGFSFDDIETLVACACSVRGIQSRPRRSIERQYKGFMKSKAASLFPTWLSNALLSAAK